MNLAIYEMCFAVLCLDDFLFAGFSRIVAAKSIAVQYTLFLYFNSLFTYVVYSDKR
jgi:hypothetical protein